MADACNTAHPAGLGVELLLPLFSVAVTVQWDLTELLGMLGLSVAGGNGLKTEVELCVLPERAKYCILK